METEVDFGASTASGRVERLSTFALTIREPEPSDRIAPTSPSSSDQAETQAQSPAITTADEAFRNGVAYYKGKEYQLAIDQLTGAIQLEPGVRNYYWYRGLANTGLSLFDEAIADYNAAIGLDPDSATLRALRGSAYSKSGQSDMALFDLDKTISLKPDHAMSYYTRGDAHTKIGQDIEAKADYDKACELDGQFCK